MPQSQPTAMPDSPASQHSAPPPGRSAAEVRAAFIKFFEERGHTFVPSSTSCPMNDPSLRDTFANAGMNQFKPIFQGVLPPGSPLAGVKRAVNSQKCIRAGGKHNDLDDVGKDTYHHTFFEMLGNWSFGDYFKEEAIGWSFELLTKVWGIDPGRLYATYFEGNPEQGLPPDLETRDLWRKYLPDDHILPGNMKDNFWEMGDTGPCGPCSEIHYDRLGSEKRGGRNAAHLVNQDDPDVLEIWNNVFIQFDRVDGGALNPLPDKHVDTGMGLERIVSVLQDRRSNYDTDIFGPLFGAIRKLTGARPYAGKLGAEDADGVDEAYRVIADHIRTLTIAITDGQMPSNESRGYVLRRILRRAVRYGRQKLNAPEGFLAGLVPTVVASLGDAFPELKKDPEKVRGIIAEEEASFGKTLDRGIKMFEDIASGSKTISGEDAFKLYDTYGFPFDLTEIMAHERGLTVDREGFEKAMEEQKERSRQGGRKDAGERLEFRAEHTAALAKLSVKPTNDDAKFAGREISAGVRAIFNGDNFDEHADASGLRRVGVILDETSFYAEMGGQVGDHGELRVTRGAGRDGGGTFRVEETQAFGGYVLHIGHVTRGRIAVGDDVACEVDRVRRERTAANHTATHLLNLALRRVVGADADQRGSLVDPDRLRFDFTHNQPVTPEELARVEAMVRERIDADLPVHAEAAPLERAKAINGLRAVFGEAYPDPVRVVSIGAPVADLLADPGSERWPTLSIEFCGGTHLASTGQAGAFALTSEEGIAKGIRRVQALTGVPARAAIEAADALDAEIDGLERMPDGELAAAAQEIAGRVDQMTLPAVRKAALRARLGDVQERVKAAKKAAAAVKAAEAQRAAEGIAASAAGSSDPVVVATLELGSDRAALEAATNTIRAACPTMAVMVLSPDPDAGRVSVMASVPKPLIDKGLKAGDWVRAVTGIMGGKGGGRPDNAQGSGSDLGKLKEAVAEARLTAMRAIS
ncbi:MAG: alanine--tRNA ligase [Phycisphaerales bacterium]|nr:alanine--tRNA ligase [Planctomycetota bacterium]MCH8509092.1 alanine--tRNA ligase [Phycisphaerales bacterium]